MALDGNGRVTGHNRRAQLALKHPQGQALLQDLRGGRDYDASFATRRSGQGIWAELVAQRFAKACLRLGLNRERSGWRTDLFRAPSHVRQMGLF